MSCLKGSLVKKSICLFMVKVLLTVCITTPTEMSLQENVKASVYDEIKKVNVSENELMEISKEAVSDGEKIAKKINQYSEYVDYEAAVIAAMTSYYKNEDFKELNAFKNAIDERSVDIIKGYENAANERAMGDSNGYEAGKVLVAFDGKATKEEIVAVVEAEHGTCEQIIKTFNDQYMVVVSISLGYTVDMAVEAYEKYSITEVAAANDYAEATEVAADYVNDTYAGSQYYLDNINVKEAWDFVSQKNHSKVIVGVIDTGIEMTHPELKDVISPYSADVTKGEKPVLLSQCSSTYTKAHGTNVAGVIAAKANNNNFMAGVASCYNNDVVEILAVQASTYYSDYNDYRFSAENAIKAINYCVEKGAKVINYSVGALNLNSYYEQILEDVSAKGVIFVCCAGNEATDASYGPADVDEAISAVATDRANNLCSFTNYGMKKDICAPGADIYTTTIYGGMTYANGTSFSSPIIASIAAMMCSVNSKLDYNDVRTILAKTSVDIGVEDQCRNGLVNAGAAVKMAYGYEPDSYTLCNHAKNKSVSVSSIYDPTNFPVSNLVDGSEESKWISAASKGQTVTVDLGEKYLVNNIEVLYDKYIISGLKAYISNDGKTWKQITDDSTSILYTSDIQVGMTTARYVKLYYVNNSSYVIIKEIKIWGYNTDEVDSPSAVPDNTTQPVTTQAETTTQVETTTQAETTTQVETTTQAETTTHAETTEIKTTTQTMTTSENANVPLEVIAPLVSCPLDNTVGIVWGQDSQRIVSGCKYNVYIDGIKLLSEVQCGYYTINVMKSGTATVRVTSILNGIESAGVTLTVWVTGKEKVTSETAVETTTVPTTTVATTTVESTTVEQNADEIITEINTELITEKETTIESVTEETTTKTSLLLSNENIAKGKKVYTSSSENDTLTGKYSVDGDMNTRWSSQWSDNEWIYVDLGALYDVAKVNVIWEAAFAKEFKVQVSTDAVNWQDVATLGDTYCRNYEVEFEPVNARYVRVLGMLRGTEYGYSLYELEVYAVAVLDLHNGIKANLLSEGKKVVSSSDEAQEFAACNINDGNVNTRWSSCWNDDEWIYVDLGKNRLITSVELNWEEAFATSYQIQVSQDGIIWTTVSNVTEGKGNTETINVIREARFVKVQGISRNTSYGYSLYEMNVYGY